MRFIRDCEKIIGKKVTILKSDRFNCVEDVVRKYRYVNGTHGGGLYRNVEESCQKEVGK